MSQNRPQTTDTLLHNRPGLLLKLCRLSADLTQLELAERLGVSQATVSKLEHSDSNPTIETLDRALRATGRRLELSTAEWQPGIDAATIARHLKLTPAQRLERFATKFDPTRILGRLAARSVSFVVVGDAAVLLSARPHSVTELEITYPTIEGNLESLSAALGDLGVTAKAKLTSEALRAPQSGALSTAAGPVRLRVKPAGLPTYGALRRHAAVVKLGRVSAPVASIPDLIAMRRATGKPQDLIDVEALEQARQLQRPRRGPRKAR